jgi:hypothetical protein
LAGFDRHLIMSVQPQCPRAFESLSESLRPHAERWAVQLLEVPDEQVPRILEQMLRDVLEQVDDDCDGDDDIDEVKQWLRLVGHAIVERRHELLMRGCRGRGTA